MSMPLPGFRTKLDPAETEDPVFTVYVAEVSGINQSHIVARRKALESLPAIPIMKAKDAVPPPRETYAPHSIQAQLENDHDIFHEGQQLYNPLCPLCKLQIQIDNLGKKVNDTLELESKLRSPSIRKTTRGSASYPGVYWHQHRQQWAVRLSIKGTMRDVAYFDDQELAGSAAEVARELRSAGLSLVQIARKFGVKLVMR